MLIIGITGTLGAGKGAIVEYLVEKEHFNHFSVREFLTEKIFHRGLPVNRDSMTLVANELRTRHSPSYIIDQLYERASRSGRDCVIESIRTPGEVESLRKKGNFYLFSVDAHPLIRYERIVVRNSNTDRISFETFLDNEQREMSSADPNKQNILWCIRHADYSLINDGTKEELYRRVKTVMEEIRK
ncbi:MAG: AAA family ATPase [Bacteroidetes bacterium]|nr:AAA family ATPase [Bacteroidota bacterium]